MKNAELSRYAGWSALVSAIATILGLVTLILFFTIGEPWGTLNDITSVILSLSILPVLLILYRLHRRDALTISLVTLVTGILAILVAGVFQTLLIIKVVAYAQTEVIVPAVFGLFGASLMVFGYLSRVDKSLPRILTSLSIISGAGYVLVIVGIILGGQDYPLTTIGGLIAVVCYPVWAIWFGRFLLSGKLTS